MLAKAGKKFTKNKYADAIPLFQEALSEEENPLAHLNLGRCYFETDDNRNALVHFEKSVSLFRDCDDAQEFEQKGCVMMGRTLMKMGKDAEAKEWLEKAIAIEPRDDIVKLMGELNIDEASMLARKHGLPVERVQEALDVKKLIQDMPKGVRVGSLWYVVS